MSAIWGHFSLTIGLNIRERWRVEDNMGETESSNQEKTDFERIRTRVSKEFVAHLTRAHNGVPMTTCHQCMNYQQKIVLLQEIIGSDEAIPYPLAVELNDLNIPSQDLLL